MRLGRALLRPGAGLVILDEPFDGLETLKRDELLARSRVLWRDSTLLCITHDLAATKGFDKVMVLKEGRIEEEGSPADLLRRPGSLYRSMLTKEGSRSRLWSGIQRRLWLESGRLNGIARGISR